MLSSKELVKQYVESDINDFNEFIEGLISSDIPQSDRPEKVGKVVIIGQEEDEIEEELLVSKDGEDTVLDNDVKDKENLLVNGCKEEK